MKLSEDQIDKLLKDAMPSMVESFKSEISRSIEWNVRDAAGKQITEFVKDWIAKEVLPEVEKSLIESKTGLMAVGLKFGEQAVEALVGSMLKTLNEQLSQSWNRKKLFTAMFGD
jgi:hypothetical protein